MPAINSSIQNYDASKIPLYDSVVQLLGDSIYGSGGLLSGGQYVLTAAHVAQGLKSGNTAYFYSTKGTASIPISSISIHPLYEGIETPEFDVALVKLASLPPSWATGYELYESATVYGQYVTFAGFGRQGSFGNPSVTPSNNMPKAWAANVTDYIQIRGNDITPSKWDEEFTERPASGEYFEEYYLMHPKNLTIFDFDNGEEARNALKFDYDRPYALGLGDREGIPQPGDSGAPILTSGGKIIGIVTQGVTSYYDADWRNWGSYGELSVNAMPAENSGWIKWVVSGANDKLLKTSELLVRASKEFNYYEGDVSLPQVFTVSIASDGWSTSIYKQGNEIIIDTGDSYIRLKNIKRLFVEESGGYADLVDFSSDGKYTVAKTQIDFKGNSNVVGGITNDALRAREGNDTVHGLLGNDLLLGNEGDDFLDGGEGYDIIDGGAGFDISVYTEARANYTVINKGSYASISLKSANGAVDIVQNVERLKFPDRIIALDVGLGGNAGEAYRMYQAALNRAPDQKGLASWINYLDAGNTPVAMANFFISSQEFQNTYGSLNNVSFVELMYNNVLSRNGEATGVNAWVNALGNGMTRAEVLYGFSESSENVARLQPAIGSGIEYLEWWR